MNNKLLIALLALTSACEIPAQSPSEPAAKLQLEPPQDEILDPIVPDFGVRSPIRLHATTGVNVFANLPENYFCLPEYRDTDFFYRWQNSQATYTPGREQVLWQVYTHSPSYAPVALITFNANSKNNLNYRAEYLEMVREYLSYQNMIENVDYELSMGNHPASAGYGIRIQPLNGLRISTQYCRDIFTLE